MQRHHFACARLEERLGDRRDPRNLPVRGIDLVDADDGDGPFAAFRFDFYSRTKEYLIDVATGRMHQLGGLEALDEEADPAVDFPQALLAVDIVRVLGAIA